MVRTVRRMSSTSLIFDMEHVATMDEDTNPEYWDLDGFCETHQYTKKFLRRQLRNMDKNLHDKIALLDYFEPLEEDEQLRRKIIAQKKYFKKTGRPKCYIWFEMFYQLWHLFSLMMCVLYFGFGLTIGSWSDAIQSIAVNETSFIPAATKGYQFIPAVRYYDMIERLAYHGKMTSVYIFVNASYLIFFTISTMLKAGWEAQWQWIIRGASQQGLCLAVEIFTIVQTFRQMTNDCRPEIFRKDLFNRYYRWYGILALHKDSRGEEAIEKIDAMQGALGCCGIDSYMDFYHIFATQNDQGFNTSWWPDVIGVRKLFDRFNQAYYYNTGRDIRQVPFSCCKPIWRNNMYCGDNVFYYDNNFMGGSNMSLARERFNPRGCVEVVYETCHYFRYVASYGLLYAVIIRSVIFVLIVIFSPLMHKSRPWRVKWLWELTEGFEGRRYLRFVSKKKDFWFNTLRHTHDRFDPKAFKWFDPHEIRRDIPRNTVPIPRILKLNDLPSVEELARLRYLEKSKTREKTAAEMIEEEKFFFTRPTKAYKGMRANILKLDERVEDVEKSLVELRARAEAKFLARTNFPGLVSNPGVVFNPARKTIHFRQRKFIHTHLQRLPIPPSTSDLDRSSLRQQTKIHIESNFDWVKAISLQHRARIQRLLRMEKNVEGRAIRKAYLLNEHADLQYRWVPWKPRVRLLEKEIIMADTDDVPAPPWDPHPEEPGIGFLQPSQAWRREWRRVWNEGGELPKKPYFFKKYPRGKLNKHKMMEWIWDFFPDMVDNVTQHHRYKKPRRPNYAKIPPNNKPGDRILNVLGAAEAAIRKVKDAELLEHRRGGLRGSVGTIDAKAAVRLQRRADIVAKKAKPEYYLPLAKEWRLKAKRAKANMQGSKSDRSLSRTPPTTASARVTTPSSRSSSSRSRFTSTPPSTETRSSTPSLPPKPKSKRLLVSKNVTKRRSVHPIPAPGAPGKQPRQSQAVKKLHPSSTETRSSTPSPQVKSKRTSVSKNVAKKRSIHSIPAPGKQPRQRQAVKKSPPSSTGTRSPTPSPPPKPKSKTSSVSKNVAKKRSIHSISAPGKQPRLIQAVKKSPPSSKPKKVAGEEPTAKPVKKKLKPKSVEETPVEPKKVKKRLKPTTEEKKPATVDKSQQTQKVVRAKQPIKAKARPPVKTRTIAVGTSKTNVFVEKKVRTLKRPQLLIDSSEALLTSRIKKSGKMPEKKLKPKKKLVKKKPKQREHVSDSSGGGEGSDAVASTPVTKKVKKKTVKLNVALVRSVHSVVDQTRRPQRKVNATRIQPDTARDAKTKVVKAKKEKPKKMVRVKIVRKPVPIEERKPWRF